MDILAVTEVVQMGAFHGLKTGAIGGVIGAMLLSLAHILGLNIKKPLILVGISLVTLVALLPVSAAIFTPA